MNRESLRKINVIGTSGSGKSTLSRKLALLLDIAYIEMDKIFWGPNWYWPNDEEFFQNLENALKVDRWVLDGNYTRTIPIKWEAIDLVIWLDYPFLTTLWRSIKRAIARSVTGEELWPGTGNRETLRKVFLSKDSIVLRTITSHGRIRKNCESYLSNPKFSHIHFIRLKSDLEMENFLASLKL